MINPATAQPGKKNSLNMASAGDLSGPSGLASPKKHMATGFLPPAPYRKAGFPDIRKLAEKPNKETDDLQI